MTQIPKTAKQWNLVSQTGFDALRFTEQPLPELGDSQVLVKLEAASLNYRDLAIAHEKYGPKTTENVIPGSDGAGTVIAVGKHVTRFKPGDKVVTLFNQKHFGGPLTAESAVSGLGGQLDGVLRTFAAFGEEGLVRRPAGLTALEAATLPCAGVTAWNSLFGSLDHTVTPGQWVLVQGTGGVSIFALQFAKAAGAKVIATTGSPGKSELLQKLGADHIINYRENPQWGEVARRLTGGKGVDHVVQVAGAREMAQSIAAVGIGGVISIIGYLAGKNEAGEPGFISCLNHMFTVRGVLVGSRAQMEDMIAAIEANPEKLRPVVDPKVFKLEQLREAYEYQWSGRHFAKVGIEID